MSRLPQKLEVGSNIFELIEFSLHRNLGEDKVQTGRYGVNVAKVREVVRMPRVNPLVSRVAGVAGVFELRGIPVPAIHLSVALGDPPTPLHDSQQIVVTEFSSKRAGFIVDATQRIRRIEWEKVLPPTADKHTCISGVTLVENNEFLFILDLEKVLLNIELQCDPGLAERTDLYREAPHPGEPARHPTRPPPGPRPAPPRATLLLADDSDLILRNAQRYLEASGYRVIACPNGLHAKTILEAQLAGNSSHPPIDVVVTDVEMPKLDGLSLTRWIKEHEQLRHTPVILHTSLSGKANLESGKQVGANGYVVKNDIAMLTSLLNEIVG